MDKFHLDLTDEGWWLIIRKKERYIAGRNKDAALDLIVRLNSVIDLKKSASIYQVPGGDLYVCWDISHPGAGLNWVCEIKNSNL